MHPALFAQLSHDGINPRETCTTLFPGRIELVIVIPVNLHANSVRNSKDGPKKGKAHPNVSLSTEKRTQL